jgi:hypothetical protein
MKALSVRLLRLWRDYSAAFQRALDMMSLYGRNSPTVIMQESVAKSTLNAYFDELEKHVDQEPDIYRPRPREGA